MRERKQDRPERMPGQAQGEKARPMEPADAVPVQQPQKAEDRRARRSRRLLKQGLLELMREKKFSEITVRDITERMDLNRGTFYLHYPDTTSLLQSLEDEMLQEAQRMIDEHLPEVSEGMLQPVFEPILEYIAAHREECRILFRNNASDNFTERLHKLIAQDGEPKVQEQFPGASPAEREYLLSFVTYGLIGLIKEWFDTEMKLPQAELVHTAELLVNGAAVRLLSGSTQREKT